MLDVFGLTSDTPHLALARLPLRHASTFQPPTLSGWSPAVAHRFKLSKNPPRLTGATALPWIMYDTPYFYCKSKTHRHHQHCETNRRNPAELL